MLTKKTTTKINNTSQGIRIVGATQTLTTFKTTLEICKTWTEQNSKGSLCRFYLNLWAPTLQETQLSWCKTWFHNSLLKLFKSTTKWEDSLIKRKTLPIRTQFKTSAKTRATNMLSQLKQKIRVGSRQLWFKTELVRTFARNISLSPFYSAVTIRLFVRSVFRNTFLSRPSQQAALSFLISKSCTMRGCWACSLTWWTLTQQKSPLFQNRFQSFQA